MSELAFEAKPETENHVIKHDQMISSIIQIGRVVNPDNKDPKQRADGARVLVHIGGEKEGTYIRSWMPWISARAGMDSEWWKPEVDEQVVVVAPSGNLALGIIIGTLYRGNVFSMEKNKNADNAAEKTSVLPPKEGQHIHQRVYRDGAKFSYDCIKHKLELGLKEKQEAEKFAAAFTATATGNKAELRIALGEEEAQQTLLDLKTGEVDIKAPEGLSLTIGKSILTMQKDKIIISLGDSSITITPDKISLKSATIELDGGTKLTINSSGADVA